MAYPETSQHQSFDRNKVAKKLINLEKDPYAVLQTILTASELHGCGLVAIVYEADLPYSGKLWQGF